jgi:predicted nucleic acid-binding protein
VNLADTSAWIEFDRATGSAVDHRLTKLIAQGDDLAVTEPVIAEVTSGARTDERESALRRLLFRFHLLPFDSVPDFDGAVAIYRSCRKAGVTPRGWTWPLSVRDSLPEQMVTLAWPPRISAWRPG